jgi:hypothetical protein
MTEDVEASKKEFVPSHGLTTSEALIKLQEFGKNELMEKKKPKVLLSINNNTLIISINEKIM